MTTEIVPHCVPDIPEILARIFKELDDDKKSLARLACTCQAFLELALDVLWRVWDVRMESALMNVVPTRENKAAKFKVKEYI